MIDPATGWFQIVKATIKSATFIQDLFHNTLLEHYPQTQFIVFDNGANSNLSSNKSVTIMALKPNQLQVTTNITQANAIIERVHKVVNDIFRSFDLENETINKNLE
jgi:predicted proteasome-type protease